MYVWEYHFDESFHSGNFEVSRYPEEELRRNIKVHGKMHHVHVLRKTKGNGMFRACELFCIM